MLEPVFPDVDQFRCEDLYLLTVGTEAGSRQKGSRKYRKRRLRVDHGRLIGGSPSGIKIRGTGAATKGVMARGPMA